MLKVTLKKFLSIELNDNEVYGIVTKMMIWSPVHHWWINPEDWTWNEFSDKEKKFLLKQPVVRIGLRNDSKDTIAIFLKDYGKEKNKKLKVKLGAR